jgi:glutathione peroxidase
VDTGDGIPYLESMRSLKSPMIAVILGLSAGFSAAYATPVEKKSKAAMSFFDLSANTLEGKPQPLSTYKGKVALVVNTASACGKTPQYAGLEKLWNEYEKKGVVVLGFPSNDFGKQEPGSAKEIREFCNLKYRVTFPMFEKVVTKGDGQSPVYQFLTSKHGSPKWNFHKYLVGKDGQVIREFDSGVVPEDKDLRAAIDAALK